MSNPLRMSFAALCRNARVLLDITQGELAAAAGVSRSHIAGVETGRVNPSLDVVGRIGDALGLDLQLVGQAPLVIDPRSSDLIHARCSGYIDRRFRTAGWIVGREVEVVHTRSHGWIDLVAFHPVTRTLVIVEIKTRLDDLGAIERQFAWYERSARDVAERFGWRPTSQVNWLLLLASDEVETACSNVAKSFARHSALGRHRCGRYFAAQYRPATDRGVSPSSIHRAGAPNGWWPPAPMDGEASRRIVTTRMRLGGSPPDRVATSDIVALSDAQAMNEHAPCAPNAALAPSERSMVHVCA